MGGKLACVREIQHGGERRAREAIHSARKREDKLNGRTVNGGRRSESSVELTYTLTEVVCKSGLGKGWVREGGP